MTPLHYYQQQIDAGLIHHDAEQLLVMQELNRIYLELHKRDKARQLLLGQLMRPIYAIKPVKGMYLWGNIGVGKTFLIDIFYHCLSIKKRRMHFHEFMLHIHDELTKWQGHKNPLDKIGLKIARESHVLCFDEFIVNNIVDAMILEGLLKSLFRHGVCLVTTSNTEPDELYKNGLQREAFLPAIEIIKQHTEVFHLQSKHDYRLEHLSQAGVYFSPLDEQAELTMEKCFQHFSNYLPWDDKPIKIFDRTIKIRKKAGDVVWFDFIDLCGIPRSQKDYLALAHKYHTVLISDIPIITSDQNNLITAFINLIDVLYDAHVRVVISAAADVHALYPQGRMSSIFERTKSRLIEMQSSCYVDKRNS